VYAAVRTARRKARGRRVIDVLIAATALANELPLYLRNPSDFVGLESVLEVVGVETQPLLRTPKTLQPPIWKLKRLSVEVDAYARNPNRVADVDRGRGEVAGASSEALDAAI
jgi:hypothetical protein